MTAVVGIKNAITIVNSNTSIVINTVSTSGAYLVS